MRKRVLSFIIAFTLLSQTLVFARELTDFICMYSGMPYTCHMMANLSSEIKKESDDSLSYTASIDMSNIRNSFLELYDLASVVLQPMGYFGDFENSLITGEFCVTLDSLESIGSILLSTKEMNDALPDGSAFEITKTSWYYSETCTIRVWVKVKESLTVSDFHNNLNTYLQDMSMTYTGLPNKFYYISAKVEGQVDIKEQDSLTPFAIIEFNSNNPTVYSSESGTCGDNLTWTLDSNRTLTISGMGDMYDFPSYSMPWCHLRSWIKAVVIENGVTSIGNWAFYGCENITSVTMGNDVTKIGDYAFLCCYGLTSIEIADNVTIFGICPFRSCCNLSAINVSENNQNYSSQDGVLFDKSKEKLLICPEGKMGDYKIPETVTCIYFDAFSDCSSITSIAIPDSVTDIEDGAFFCCTNLNSVNIPYGVTRIGNYTVNGCESLTSITIPDSVTSIGNYAFSNCKSLNAITIPDSVVDIGYCAFHTCSSLQTVTIGSGVTSIGDHPFAGCSSLISIDVLGSNQNYSSQDGVLFSKDKTAIIAYPKGKTGAYAIPDGVTTIDAELFYDCRGLTQITIPESVTSIGYSAFTYCYGLTQVVIPNGVTSIEDCAFSDCSNIKEIIISDSVTNIENGAFAGCSSLTSVTIGSGVKRIVFAAFHGCSSLADVYYDGNEEDWNSIAIGSWNEPLENAQMHYIPSIKITADGSGFTVTPKNIKEGNSIIFAVYKDRKMVDMQTKIYDGGNSVFSVTVPYDTVKAMVWENLKSMEPLCPLKIISQ
ncbi:MAG: leucine-rich repeat domain-containing protein [Clostridia bacterium]|nr:leucine-rich repeat domain-containing protein [Clostridia bacterium]